MISNCATCQCFVLPGLGTGFCAVNGPRTTTSGRFSLMLKFTSGGVDGLGRASRARLAYRRRLPRGHPGVPMALKQHRPTGWQRAGRKGRSAPASLGGSPARPGGQSPTPRSDRRPELWTGCAGTKENGQPCRAPKLRESEYCLMHSPDHAEEMAEARRLGGLRR